MFSTLILAFTIMTSLTVIQYGFRAIDTARNTTIAGQILQSAMEDLRMLTWTSGSGSSITSLEATNNNVAGNVQLDASFAAVVTHFTITRNITDVTSSLKQIDLTATWIGIDGRPHSLKYTTYYGKNGLHDYFVK